MCTCIAGTELECYLQGGGGPEDEVPHHLVRILCTVTTLDHVEDELKDRQQTLIALPSEHANNTALLYFRKSFFQSLKKRFIRQNIESNLNFFPNA